MEARLCFLLLVTLLPAVLCHPLTPRYRALAVYDPTNQRTWYLVPNDESSEELPLDVPLYDMTWPQWNQIKLEDDGTGDLSDLPETEVEHSRVKRSPWWRRRYRNYYRPSFSSASSQASGGTFSSGGFPFGGSTASFGNTKTNAFSQGGGAAFGSAGVNSYGGSGGFRPSVSGVKVNSHAAAFSQPSYYRRG